MAARKSSSDWQSIELEYCAGEDSVREIADRYELSDTAIRKKAKAEGWVRKVRTAKKRELSPSAPAPAAVHPETPIDAAAIAEGGRELIHRMLDELDRDSIRQAVSLPTRAATLKTLATALKTLNETSAPLGKKAAQQQKAEEVASRFRPIGPPKLKAV